MRAAALLLVLSLAPVAARADGILNVKNGAGSTVYLDGQVVGTSPLHLTGLPGGSHTVRVRAVTGHERSFAVFFPRRSVLTKEIDLASGPASGEMAPALARAAEAPVARYAPVAAVPLEPVPQVVAPPPPGYAPPPEISYVAPSEIYYNDPYYYNYYPRYTTYFPFYGFRRHYGRHWGGGVGFHQRSFAGGRGFSRHGFSRGGRRR